MKPTGRYKMWIKRWEGWLEQKPDSKPLKKMIKEAKSDLEQWRKERNNNSDYIKFHKAYIEVGSNNKDAGWDNWKKYVVDRDVDPMVVISAVPAYFADCKKTDTSILNGERFLSGSRWEKYEGVKERVVNKRMCQLCKVNPSANQISIQQYYDLYKAHRPCTYNVCTECTGYKGWKSEDIKDDINKVKSITSKPVPQAESRPLDVSGTPTKLLTDPEQGVGSLSAPIPTTHLGSEMDDINRARIAEGIKILKGE